MASTLLTFLVCTVIVTFGLADNATNTQNSLKDVCMNNTAAMLADGECRVLCDGKLSVSNESREAQKGTPCVNISEANQHEKMVDNMKNLTCVDGKCQLSGQNMTNASTASTTMKPDTSSSEAGPVRSTARTPNTSSHMNGTTMPPTSSHRWTTAHANMTTTKAPGSAASPSRLLGATNQGAVIAVLALALVGRSL